MKSFRIASGVRLKRFLLSNFDNVCFHPHLFPHLLVEKRLFLTGEKSGYVTGSKFPNLNVFFDSDIVMQKRTSVSCTVRMFVKAWLKGLDYMLYYVMDKNHSVKVIFSTGALSCIWLRTFSVVSAQGYFLMRGKLAPPHHTSQSAS